MFKRIRSAWNNNHGTQLLVIGCVASVAMCLLWYRQWLPEINFGQPAAISRPTGTVTAPGHFVGRIVSSPPADGEQVRGLLLLFAYHTLDEVDQHTPTRTLPFQLDPEGTATIVEELPPGRYAAFAFLDYNENGRLDFNSAGDPLEPFQTSSPTQERQDFKNLRPAAFAIQPDRPHFCRLRFNGASDGHSRRNENDM